MSLRKKKFYRGFLNRYQYSKPALKYLIEDLRYSLVWTIWTLTANLRGDSVRRILTFPHLPSKKSSIYRLAMRKKMILTNRPRGPFNTIIFWEYATQRADQKKLDEIIKKPNFEGPKKILNYNSIDIGKLAIDRAFLEIFGYSTAVDPLSWTDKLVVKSDKNATHDGKIVEGPLPQKNIEPDKIYQRLIDNSVDSERVLDYRTPVVGGDVPFVLKKFRHKKVRFTNDTELVEKEATKDVFTKDELQNIQLFCEKICLDFGELDILRDNHSKKIYIVDVNNTPQSPPAGTRKKLSDEILKELDAIMVLKGFWS